MGKKQLRGFFGKTRFHLIRRICMKKKLLALAVAGAFVAPAAMADTANVTVYGAANVSLEMVDNGSAGATSGTRVNKVSSNASHIGFKGSEDLGGGMAAIWQLETLLAMDANGAGAGGLGNGRNTFAGLKGDSWGQVVLGNNDSPYKSSTRRLDVFKDTIADNRSLMGGIAGKSTGVSFDSRNTDSITYTSPNMSGFTLGLQYGAAAAEAATLSANQKGSLWSVAGAYDMAPLYVSAAYENHTSFMAGAGTQPRESSYRLGAGYKMDQIEGSFVYEKNNDNFGAVAGCAGAAADSDCYGRNAWTLGGKFNISGSDAVKLAYTRSGEKNGGNIAANKNNTGANQFSVGYDHAMSKRTTVYALYTKLNNNTAASFGLGAAATSTGAVAAIADADPSAFAIGMKHSF
jgi:predicted porin